MSWIEVECKIKVDNVKEARKRIKQIAKFVKIENKIDEYYSLKSGVYPKKSLRVRNKGEKREVNFKQRLPFKKGIWAKKEVEFEVSDLDNFFDLLDDFGFKKWLKKEKRTELYKTKNGVNIELNYVKRLGWFIELEILCKPTEIKKSREKIEEIRRKLAFPQKNIEKSGYTSVLWRLKNS